jgi:hypothetical protein
MGHGTAVGCSAIPCPPPLLTMPSLDQCLHQLAKNATVPSPLPTQTLLQLIIRMRTSSTLKCYSSAIGCAATIVQLSARRHVNRAKQRPAQLLRAAARMMLRYKHVEAACSRPTRDRHRRTGLPASFCLCKILLVLGISCVSR